ncbi:hypothetical protein CTAYLR_005071 [Chrysophaeum taylorii]|uniref:Uncharacterized protein n=1 Tax=Chrysophaeum taylorii TaxID=2483200 RepID=A0AAD7UAA5_9STRA|nr:hypothetical protein CTAYLR_005071 [Chrysophaeum taylorii]
MCRGRDEVDEENMMIGGTGAKHRESLAPENNNGKLLPESDATSGVSTAGLKVLALLAIQNCAKNLVMRAAVRGDAHFLYSAAVIGTEGTKCTLSTLYVLCTGGTPKSISIYLWNERRKFLLLSVPAGIYNFQQTLEYVALKNLNAAIFSVIVQTKLLTTAVFSAAIMGRKLRKAQVISLALLTSGVMLAQLHSKGGAGELDPSMNRMTGVLATLGIAASSGFAAVYTEKVIKAAGRASEATQQSPQKSSGLAYTQIQLALTSLIIEGAWAAVSDYDNIRAHGLWYGVDFKAMLSILNSAVGGLTVAAVLKFADAVLKGYATAISVMLTGVFSYLIFGTLLSIEYLLGMVNVVASVVLYNAKNLEQHAW